MKKPFRIAFIFLELAVISFFLHSVAVNLLKIKDVIFLPAACLLVLASLVVSSYGLSKRLINFVDKKINK